MNEIMTFYTAAATEKRVRALTDHLEHKFGSNYRFSVAVKEGAGGEPVTVVTSEYVGKKRLTITAANINAVLIPACARSFWMGYERGKDE